MITTHDNKVIYTDDLHSILKTINNINFTNREIDVISCLLIGGKSSKTIASYFSISDKTVDNHIGNIMIKLGCNSRERIIDFVEKSGKFINFKDHYFTIRVKVIFELTLKKVSVTAKNNTNCLIFYYTQNKIKDPLVCELEKHLNASGINVDSKIWNKNKCDNFTSNKKAIKKADCIIYIISDEFIECLKTTKHKINKEAFTLTTAFNKTTSHIVFLLLTNETTPEFDKKISDFVRINISLAKQGDYYFSFFELLKKVFPSVNIDKNIESFKKQYKTLTAQFPIEKDTDCDHKLKKEELSYLPHKGSGVFIRRKRYFDEFRAAEKQNNNFFVIHGTSGVGKSSLALQLGHEKLEQYKKKESLNNHSYLVCWFNADINLDTAYRKFAKKLKIHIPEKTESLVINVNNYLEEYFEHVLLIFDNVEKEEIVSRYLPWTNKKTIKCIITSQNKIWSVGFYQIQEVHDFNQNESKSFINKNNVWRTKISEESVNNLAETLHYFPLALQHAIESINKYYVLGITAEEAIIRYLTGYNLLPNTNVKQYTEHEKSVMNTWRMSINRLASEEAKNFLIVCAYIDAVNIPKSLLKEYLKKYVPNCMFLLDDIVIELVSTSLLIVEKNNDFFRIHRMLQKAVRIYCETEEDNDIYNHDNAKKVINNLLNLLCELIPEDCYESCVEKWDEIDYLINHALILVKNLAKNGDDTLHLKLLNGVRNFQDFARHSNYDALNTGQTLEKMILQSKRYSKTPYLVVAKHNLANTYGAIGNIEKKRQLLSDSILLLSEVEMSDLDKAIILYNYGNIFCVTGDYNIQRIFLEISLYILNCILDQKQHPLFGKIMHDLANSYGMLGFIEDQACLLEKALSIQKKGFGPESTPCAKVLTSIAVVLKNLNCDINYQIRLLETVLNIQTKCHKSKNDFLITKTAYLLLNLYESKGIQGSKKRQIEYLKKQFIHLNDPEFLTRKHEVITFRPPLFVDNGGVDMYKTSDKKNFKSKINVNTNISKKTTLDKKLSTKSCAISNTTFLPKVYINGGAGAAIFDFDGTLVDTLQLQFLSWEHAFSHYKYKLTSDFFFMELSGMSSRETVKKINKLSGNSFNYDKIKKRKDDFFLRHLDKVNLFKSTIEIVNNLRGKLPIAIVSGASSINVHRILEALERKKLIQKKWFSCVVTIDDIETKIGKPNPYLYRKAAEILKVCPKKCLVFEDSQSGMEAAARANMYTIDIKSITKLCYYLKNHNQHTCASIFIATFVNLLCFNSFADKINLNKIVNIITSKLLNELHERGKIIWSEEIASSRFEDDANRIMLSKHDSLFNQIQSIMNCFPALKKHKSWCLVLNDLLKQRDIMNAKLASWEHSDFLR